MIIFRWQLPLLSRRWHPAYAWPGIAAVVALFTFCPVVGAELSTGVAGPSGWWNVREAGALGDGTNDDTAAFQQALDQAAAAGGGVVFVPAGRYRIAGTLRIPANVRLEGIFRYSPTLRWGRVDDLPGSVLLAFTGRGQPAEAPFIRLAGNNASVAGVVIFYPEVTPRDVPPVPYPPCILAEGVENVSVQDCLLVNPYEGIRLVRAARHLVRNVMGYPIWRGIYVDECYDIGRIENIHFWPFGVVYRPEDPFCRWINLNGIAFEFARTDWHYVYNTFCFGYGVGYKFSESARGSANGNFLGIGADCCERAVLVEQCQPPGLLITNGEFVGRWTSQEAITLEIRPEVVGLVSLVNCSFWGPIDRCVLMQSRTGQLVLNSCHFCEWDVASRGSPAVELTAGRTLIQACTFQQASRWHIAIEPEVESVSIFGVQTRGRTFIKNNASEKTTIVPPTLTEPPLSREMRGHYRIEIGQQGDERFLLLCHGAEKGPRPFRWSAGRSFLVLPVIPGRAYRVLLEVAIPPHLPPEAFAVYVNGEKLALLSAGVNELAVPPTRGEEVVLEIRGPAWVPAERDPRSKDRRQLGIQLFSVEVFALEPSPPDHPETNP